MSRQLLSAALSIWCGIGAHAVAEPTAAIAPPAWQDGASVYLTLAQRAQHDSQGAGKIPAMRGVLHARVDRQVVTPMHDAAVLQAGQTAAMETGSKTDRRLRPPSNSNRTSGGSATSSRDRAGDSSRHLPGFGVPLTSLYTILSALAVVIGAFLLCVWLLKRGAARNSAAVLPPDVVSVLGRVPLADRQFADLLRVGNKLVLILLTPTGAATLSEVTDPGEVDRLVGLCQQADPRSTTNAFEQVFRQMSLEPARGGFLGNEQPLPSLQSTIDALRAQRGEAAHA